MKFKEYGKPRRCENKVHGNPEIKIRQAYGSTEIQETQLKLNYKS